MIFRRKLAISFIISTILISGTHNVYTNFSERTFSPTREISEFTHYKKDGSPVIWDKGRPLKVVMLGSDSQSLRLVESALTWLHRELGIRTQIVGFTPIPASTSWYRNNIFGAPPPVNISFTFRYESDLLNDPSAIAATVANQNSSTRPAIVTGAIAIDRVAFVSLPRESRIALLRHELGHLVGFGHDESDVMSPILRDIRSNSLSPKKRLHYMQATSK